MMPADLKELLRALNAHSVKFSAPIPNRGPRRTWIFSFSPMRRTARPSTARSPTSALLCTTFHQPIFAMAAPFRLAALPPESISSSRSTESPSTRPGRIARKQRSRAISRLPSSPARTSSAISSPADGSRICSTSKSCGLLLRSREAKPRKVFVKAGEGCGGTALPHCLLREAAANPSENRAYPVP